MFEAMTLTSLLYSLPIFAVAFALSFLAVPRIKEDFGLVAVVAVSLIVWAAGIVVLTSG